LGDKKQIGIILKCNLKKDSEIIFGLNWYGSNGKLFLVLVMYYLVSGNTLNQQVLFGFLNV
jgi:hypothetical protein